MTLGPDDNYYIINKVSSMGNGFTFDLMTLVLTALTRSFDHSSTVFGDDIIVENQYAEEVIENLQIAGFIVNLNKTNIRSDYRESCGANYLDGVGYITSFDFKWVTNLQELIVTCNKVAILSLIYNGSLETLRAGIWSCVPMSLLGATVSRLTVHTGRPPSYELDSFVRYGPIIQIAPTPKLLKVIRRSCKLLHKTGPISVAVSCESRQLPAKTRLSSREWDVFFQYIRDSRLNRKVPRMVIKSSLVARVGEEQIGLTKALSP